MHNERNPDDQREAPAHQPAGKPAAPAQSLEAVWNSVAQHLRTETARLQAVADRGTREGEVELSRKSIKLPSGDKVLLVLSAAANDHPPAAGAATAPARVALDSPLPRATREEREEDQSDDPGLTAGAVRQAPPGWVVWAAVGLAGLAAVFALLGLVKADKGLSPQDRVAIEQLQIGLNGLPEAVGQKNNSLLADQRKQGSKEVKEERDAAVQAAFDKVKAQFPTNQGGIDEAGVNALAEKLGGKIKVPPQPAKLDQADAQKLSDVKTAFENLGDPKTGLTAL